MSKFQLLPKWLCNAGSAHATQSACRAPLQGRLRCRLRSQQLHRMQLVAEQQKSGCRDSNLLLAVLLPVWERSLRQTLCHARVLVGDLAQEVEQVTH